MDTEVMSAGMRERIEEVVQFGRAEKIELTADHIDQAMINEPGLFAAYTPWGIVAIEAAFLDRMDCPAQWDSKDLIRKDLLLNPHLHSNIKLRLFQVFEKVDWARWFDSYFAQAIMTGPLEGLQARIEGSSDLSEASRENLLYNLALRREDT